MMPTTIALRLMPIRMQIRYLAVAAAVCFTLAATGLYLWEQAPLNTDTQPGLDRTYGYTSSSLVGMILFMSFAASAVVLTYNSSQLFVQYAYLPEHTRTEAAKLFYCSLGIQVFLGAFFTVLSTVLLTKWGRETMSCGILFCLGVENHSAWAKTRGYSFNFLIAFMMFCSLVPLSCIMWYRAYTFWQLQRAARAALLEEEMRGVVYTSELQSSEAVTTTHVADKTSAARGKASHHRGITPSIANPMAKPVSMRLFKDERRMKKFSRIIGLSLGICACAVVTFWLPNDPRRFHPANMARFANMTVRRDISTMTEVVVEMPYAWFRTGQIRLGANLVLKLFPGNVFFYVYLLSVAVIVFLLRQTQNGRYWMQRRIPRCPCFTFGEAAFVVATVWLCVFFFIYWLRDHNYKNAWSADPTQRKSIQSAERWGRGLGQLAILFLSLLLLPIGRQSVVVTVLGVSRDSLLWFHRAVGYAMLAATLAHIIAFYVSYHEYGLLWHNLNFLPVTVGATCVVNDFTVVAATWTTWFLLVAMGIFGLNAVRRRYYELFYYTHLAATYMTLPMMIFHAAAGWMYMLPGATIFLADQLVRVWQRSAVVQVVHARTISDDTVELAFTVPGHWDMRRVHPGQYVLICVPELTALQWHPFTLTNVVDDQVDDSDLGSGNGDRDSHSHSHRHSHGCLPAGVAVSTAGTVFYLHIKSMGPLTWTGRLYDLVSTGQTFSMGVEGPCGTPVDYSHYDDIVLVAGGIGAAPCISVYGSLLRSYLRSIDGAGVPRVRLLWSTRSASLVGAVADMLQLPLAYRNLVKVPRMSENVARTKAVAAADPHADGSMVEVDASRRVRNEDFTCNIYVTRTGELSRFIMLDESGLTTSCDLCNLSPPALTTDEGAREGAVVRALEEELPDMREGWSASTTPFRKVKSVCKAAATMQNANRGARLRVFEGRPRLSEEVRLALLDPETGEVRGDVRRKLVLVCGPEGMVEDATAAAAEIGVAVHTEEFLF